MKKYEKIMEAVQFNIWAKSMGVSSQYNPNEFTGISYEYKEPKKKTLITKIKELICR